MSDAECLLIYSVLHIKSGYCYSHGFLPYIGNPMVLVAIDQLEALFLSCQPIRASSTPSPVWICLGKNWLSFPLYMLKTLWKTLLTA